jgi:hypothetical protein
VALRFSRLSILFLFLLVLKNVNHDCQQQHHLLKEEGQEKDKEDRQTWIAPYTNGNGCERGQKAASWERKEQGGLRLYYHTHKT